MEHPKISLPADWNAEKDCDYFEERWKPLPSYTEALWHWMRFHHRIFVETLDAALEYMHRRDATLVHVEPLCLTPLEKISILLEIARASASARDYRQRLIENLETCEFAETERQRVLRDYRLAGEQAWMYPVIEVIDCIGDAAFLLRETMICENEDYRELSERLPGDEEID